MTNSLSPRNLLTVSSWSRVKPPRIPETAATNPIAATEGIDHAIEVTIAKDVGTTAVLKAEAVITDLCNAHNLRTHAFAVLEEIAMYRGEEMVHRRDEDEIGIDVPSVHHPFRHREDRGPHHVADRALPPRAEEETPHHAEQSHGNDLGLVLCRHSEGAIEQSDAEIEIGHLLRRSHDETREAVLVVEGDRHPRRWRPADHEAFHHPEAGVGAGAVVRAEAEAAAAAASTEEARAHRTSRPENLKVDGDHQHVLWRADVTALQLLLRQVVVETRYYGLHDTILIGKTKRHPLNKLEDEMTQILNYAKDISLMRLFSQHSLNVQDYEKEKFK